MNTAKTSKPTPELRRQYRLAMYVCGTLMTVLAVAFAFLVPEILGEDPEAYRIVGGLTALVALSLFWHGYYHGRDRDGEKSSSQVFKMRD